MLRGEREGYDESADVFSFGVCLWEVLTGKSPWAGFSAEQARAHPEGNEGTFVSTHFKTEFELLVPEDLVQSS